MPPRMLTAVTIFCKNSLDVTMSRQWVAVFVLNAKVQSVGQRFPFSVMPFALPPAMMPTEIRNALFRLITVVAIAAACATSSRLASCPELPYAWIIFASSS